MTAAPTVVEVRGSLDRFLNWLKRVGYSSHDQYDFWATPYGVWSKGLYYRFGKVAAPLVAPLIAADWLIPSSRRWFRHPSRFAIADAHYVMGHLACYRASGDEEHLHTARDVAAHLLESSTPGFAGPCWGYPFDWQTSRGLWKAGTPLVTTTTYVFDAFVELYALTNGATERQVACSIAEFLATDICDTPVGPGRAAGYTPFDASQVINASAYRAACLTEAGVLTNIDRYRQIADRNTRFVLDCQKPDGSWPYSASDPRDQFVDHFHTCFVLQSLYRVYRVSHDAAILEAIRRGYGFYRAQLFYDDGRPRPFARGHFARLHVLELYDHAEALHLALLMRDESCTGDHAADLARHLLRLQTSDGCFLTRISSWRIQNRVPYHRWAQAQAFCALARYFEHLSNNRIE